MLAIHVSHWVRKHPLSPIHVDCATTVMLKILDGKCKMAEQEKRVMSMLYEAVKHQQGQLLGDDIRQLIAQVQYPLTDDIKMFIYEKRVLAETAISRPVMKGFKAMIREQGLFMPGKVTLGHVYLSL